jgi:hypothetical protein
VHVIPHIPVNERPESQIISGLALIREILDAQKYFNVDTLYRSSSNRRYVRLYVAGQYDITNVTKEVAYACALPLVEINGNWYIQLAKDGYTASDSIAFSIARAAKLPEGVALGAIAHTL